MTNSSRSLRHAVRYTLAASAIAAGSPLALAQQAPPTTAAAPVEEVVVTGSRIQQAPNEISISPVTSVTAIDVQQTGLVRTEDLLNNLPQVVAEQSSGQSISSNGLATVSLRGLGSNRTLVLVNGKRLNPGGGIGVGFSNVADINQIPADLIERADVLTGGASAVYGADAVAGVVNFVLNTHYEGVQLNANYGFGQHKNDNQNELNALAKFGAPKPDGTVDAGFNKDVSFVGGSNFADGKGNVTVYATYLNSAPAVGNQYDYAGCTLNTPASLPKPGAKYACGGSSSSATGRYMTIGYTPTPGGGRTSTLFSNDTVKAAGFVPYHGATDSYNYGALSYLQRAAERYTAGAFLHYNVTDHADVYSETMYARNESTAQYGPSGAFAFLTPEISCADPLLTAQEVATICNPANLPGIQAYANANIKTYILNPVSGNNTVVYLARRSVESGPRLDNYTSNSIRQVLGVKGDINEVWKYDAYGQVGITTFQDVEGNFLGAPQIGNALDVVTSPTTGQPVCRSTITNPNNPIDSSCVPWNLWNFGGITQAALDYLRVASSYQTKATEYVVDGSVTGDLGKYGVKLPSAASGMVVNVGAEYRQESYDFTPDFVFANGFASGGNGAAGPIHGEFHASELFTEFRLPLIDEKPGAYNLSFEGGYRYSKYTSGFDTSTFKLGLEWAPIQDLRFRGSYNRAIRAPSIGDLFAPAVTGAGGTADPCWGTTPSMSLAGCIRTGINPANYGHILPNPAAQINTESAGTPTLQPEIADTYSVGFVLQPQVIPNLLVSVDYYDIKIKQTITSLSTNTIIQDCGATGDPTICGFIHRGAGSSLWFNNDDFVSTHQLNIGAQVTKGIDLAAHYGMQLGAMGKLAFNLQGTRVQSFTTQPLPTGGSYDCAGLAGAACGPPDPHWRHVFTADWATPWAGLDLTLRWRYVGENSVDATSSNPQLAAVYFPDTAHIPAYNYLDLSASIPLGTMVSFRLGINNIADKAPPIVLNGNYTNCPNSTCNDNTWVGTYDTLGRYMYAHVSAKF